MSRVFLSEGWKATKMRVCIGWALEKPEREWGISCGRPALISSGRIFLFCFFITHLCPHPGIFGKREINDWYLMIVNILDYYLRLDSLTAELRLCWQFNFIIGLFIACKWPEKIWHCKSIDLVLRQKLFPIHPTTTN